MVAVEGQADEVFDKIGVHRQRSLNVSRIYEIVSVGINHFVEKIDVGFGCVFIEILEKQLGVFERICRHRRCR